MLYQFSRIGTYLFTPLLMPFLLIYLALRLDPYLIFFVNSTKGQLTLLIVVIATLLFPLINLFFLKKAGFISNYHLHIRRERIAPTITTIIYYCLGYYLIKQARLPISVYSLYVGVIVAALLALLISLRWKISMHAIGIAGVTGGVYGLFKIHHFVNFPLLITLIFITGWVMSSRLVLKAHTPAQVYAGAVLGFLTTYFSVINGLLI